MVPPTVRLLIIVADPLDCSDPTLANPVHVSDPTVASAVHVSDPTVASPVQARAPIVYVAAVSSAKLRYVVFEVSNSGAWHMKPFIDERTGSKRVVNPVSADVVWLSVACLVKIDNLIDDSAVPVRVAIDAVPIVVTRRSESLRRCTR